MSKIMDAQEILSDARNCVECAILAVDRDVHAYQRDAIQVVLGIASKKIEEADALLDEYRAGNATPVSDSAN
jgi:hypothetical protein